VQQQIKREHTECDCANKGKPELGAYGDPHEVAYFFNVANWSRILAEFAEASYCSETPSILPFTPLAGNILRPFVQPLEPQGLFCLGSVLARVSLVFLLLPNHFSFESDFC
jgi:hypothetical protein